MTPRTTLPPAFAMPAAPPAAATSILPSPTLIAAGLEPDALEPGLAREQPLERLDGHAKAAASTFGRFDP